MEANLCLLEGVAMGSRRTKKQDKQKAKDDAAELALLLYDIYKDQEATI
jgi:hypothetical protein